MQSPLASTVPPTPMTPIAAYAAVKGLVQSGLEGTTPADMLNVLSAHRESVNTADGKATIYVFDRWQKVLVDFFLQ